ncbi:MAG: tetracycline resistance MFS efflux pump, partial [Steroidobacteraceae bacterium]|nr:tetracycline resistance MFS efflux pump [Steroidobacteraceae bacterium]MDW8258129.1 tetracycline resistance MFS efflux pump [Gammaproteobacteria bacterium]
VGLVLAAIGIATAVVQGFFIRPLVRLMGERGALLFGLGAGALGFAMYGYAPVGALFLLAVPIQALWGMASPALQSMMSRRVGITEQGRLQGAIMSLRGVAGVVGPAVFANTFRIGIETSRPIPGLALYLAAALLVLAWLWAFARVPAMTSAPPG